MALGDTVQVDETNPRQQSYAPGQQGGCHYFTTEPDLTKGVEAPLQYVGWCGVNNRL
uniref:Uncharacterized protein n=1 Tax=Arion vulgaris TaxID=1028688 RepID=A0A0B6ZJU0_9EUPU